MSMVKDIGAYIKAVTNVAHTTGSTAGTDVNGAAFDRRDDLTSHYQSCKVVVPFSYIKATGTTISITPRLQHSSLSTAGFANLSTGAAVTVAAAVAATAAARNIAELDVDLTVAKRYLRVVIAPQISAQSSVNGIDVIGVIMFGGGDVNPAA